MPNKILRYATEHLSRVIGVALGVAMVAGAVAIWAYASSHPIWLDRAITAVVAVAVVAYVTWMSDIFIKPDWQSLLQRDLLRVVTALRDTSPTQHRPAVKLLATKQGSPLAQEIARILKYCDWKLEINHENQSYIFLIDVARFKGIRLRLRPDCAVRWKISDALTIATEFPIIEEFPDTDAFDFIQIEVGDRPRFRR